MGASKGFVDVLDEGTTGGLRNVEVALVIKSALVKVPVFGERAR